MFLPCINEEAYNLNQSFHSLENTAPTPKFCFSISTYKLSKYIQVPIPPPPLFYPVKKKSNKQKTLNLPNTVSGITMLEYLLDDYVAKFDKELDVFSSLPYKSPLSPKGVFPFKFNQLWF